MRFDLGIDVVQDREVELFIHFPSPPLGKTGPQPIAIVSWRLPQVEPLLDAGKAGRLGLDGAPKNHKKEVLSLAAAEVTMPVDVTVGHSREWLFA